MLHFIAPLAGHLLRLLLPARGRHRAPALPATEVPQPLAAPLLSPATQLLSPAQVPSPLRGEDSVLVRPYVLTPDEYRRETRLRRQRRRALWLAVHGVDVGPRWIHGVEVTA